MFKVVHTVDKVLYPRLDKTFYEVAHDELYGLLADHPEFSGMSVNLKVHEYSNKSTARLLIVITDRSKVETKWEPLLIAVFLILLVLWFVFS